MGGRFLLDTCCAIALFAADAGALERLAGAESVFVSTVVIGEFCYGALKSAHPHENLALIDELVANTPVLACDADTGRRYGEVKNELRRKGHPIPENDIWIAAAALQHDLTLATRDTHFRGVDGLDAEAW